MFLQYPKEIRKLEYRPDFTIRGLHYDIEKGLLMKLDSFLQIQLGTVYRGLTPVPDEQVIKLYKNKIVPIAYVEDKEKFGAVSFLNFKKYFNVIKYYKYGFILFG